jgi:hypothetical protein
MQKVSQYRWRRNKLRKVNLSTLAAEVVHNSPFSNGTRTLDPLLIPEIACTMTAVVFRTAMVRTTSIRSYTEKHVKQSLKRWSIESAEKHGRKMARKTQLYLLVSRQKQPENQSNHRAKGLG